MLLLFAYLHMELIAVCDFFEFHKSMLDWVGWLVCGVFPFFFLLLFCFVLTSVFLKVHLPIVEE